jgi:hypothetical protein
MSVVDLGEMARGLPQRQAVAGRLIGQDRLVGGSRIAGSGFRHGSYPQIN